MGRGNKTRFLYLIIIKQLYQGVHSEKLWRFIEDKSAVSQTVVCRNCYEYVAMIILIRND